MGNQNDKKKSQKARQKKKTRPTIMSFSEAEKKNLLEKWKEDKYLVNKNKIIDYPNKSVSLNIYLYQCLYISIKKNPSNINVYCPYCLKTQNYESVIEPESNTYTFNFDREFYEEKLLKDMDDDTIKNEVDILKRYSNNCKHFFHTKCIEEINKTYRHICYYCQNHINVENIILFGGFKDYEELGTYVAEFKRVSYETKQCYNFEKRLLGILRNFIKTNEKIKETYNGWKWKRAIEFGEKFRSLWNKYKYYEYPYDFCINKNETYNYNEDKFIEEEKKAISNYEEKMRKKKEREKRRRELLRQRREAEEEEEEEEYSNTSSKRKKRYGRYAHTCPDCNKKCYICGKKDYPLYWRIHYAHIDCLNSIKYGCVVCKQRKFDVHHDLQCCKSCKGKINNKVCILCNGEIDK